MKVPITEAVTQTMMSKARAVLDDGFLVGLVFALFLAGKIVPFLILVGIVPILLFWAKSDYAKTSDTLSRLLIPTGIYFTYSIGLFFIYPGLAPGQEPPRNPSLELYALGIAMLIIGFLRGHQIRNLFSRFQIVVPLSLLIAFVVLSAYMFLGINGCRVKVAAAWPFIPAIIFTTLTFLLLLKWEYQSKNQRYLRLLLISLSIVVVLGYTGSRGVAAGQFAVLACFILLRFLPAFRRSLPTFFEFGTAIAAGLALSLLVGVATGCNGFDRWPALLQLARQDVAESQSGTEAHVRMAQVETSYNKRASDFVPNTDTTFSSDTSISLRIYMWAVSRDAIQKAPWFGHGALSLRSIIQEKFGFENNHNQYLAWLVTGGVVFFGIGLLFLCTPIFISRGMSISDRIVLSLSVTGLWGVALIFDAFFNLKFYLQYFSLMLGFLFALVNSAAMTDSYRKHV